MISKGSINSDIFWYFLSQLIAHLQEAITEKNNLYLFVSDNATIHKTNKGFRILKARQIGLITIIQYSSWLNLVEGYISYIKKKIRMKLDKNKILTELMIKIWVKNASVGDPQNFINASRKETMKIVRKLKNTN